MKTVYDTPYTDTTNNVSSNSKKAMEKTSENSRPQLKDGKTWLNNCLLIGLNLLLDSCATTITMFHFSRRQLSASGLPLWLHFLIGGLIQVSSLIGGILADNFLGRYQLVAGCMLLRSIALFCMAFGSISVPKIGWTGIDIAAVWFNAILMGCTGPALFALIGDQSLTDRQRLLSFALTGITTNMAGGFSWLFTTFAEKNKCLRTDHCYILPYFAGSMVAAIFFCTLLLFKRRWIRQVTFQGNVVATVYHMIKYSIQMRLTSSERGKSIITHAKELNAEIAVDLQRLSRNLFLIILVAIHRLHKFSFQYTNYLQAHHMNPYEIGNNLITIDEQRKLKYLGYSAAAIILFVYCYLWSQKFSPLKAIKISVVLQAISVLANIWIEAYIRYGGYSPPAGYMRFGMSNSLNCSVTLRGTVNDAQFNLEAYQTMVKTTTFTSFHINLHPECNSGPNYNASAFSSKHFDTATFIDVYRVKHRIAYEIYEIEAKKLQKESWLFGNKETMKVFDRGVEVPREDGPFSKEHSKLFKWRLKRASNTTVFTLTGGQGHDTEFNPNTGSTYFANLHGKNTTLFELIPGYRPSLALHVLPFLTSRCADSLLTIVSLVFTYEQAPARMRALLFGLVFTSPMLSSIILLPTLGWSYEIQFLKFIVTGLFFATAMIYGGWQLKTIGLCDKDPVQEDMYL